MSIITEETPGAVAMLCTYVGCVAQREATAEEVALGKKVHRVIPGDGLFKIGRDWHFVRWEVPVLKREDARGVLFRFYRGTYADSMSTTVEVDDLDALKVLLYATFPVNDGGTVVLRDTSRTDDRNGWDTHAVTLNGELVGYTSSVLA